MARTNADYTPHWSTVAEDRFGLLQDLFSRIVVPQSFVHELFFLAAAVVDLNSLEECRRRARRSYRFLDLVVGTR